MLFEATGSTPARGSRKPHARTRKILAELERESGFAAAAVAPYKPHPRSSGRPKLAENQAVEVCGLELRRQHVLLLYRSAHNYYILLTCAVALGLDHRVKCSALCLHIGGCFR